MSPRGSSAMRSSSTATALGGAAGAVTDTAGISAGAAAALLTVEVTAGEVVGGVSFTSC